MALENVTQVGKIMKSYIMPKLEGN